MICRSCQRHPLANPQLEKIENKKKSGPCEEQRNGLCKSIRGTGGALGRKVQPSLRGGQDILLDVRKGFQTYSILVLDTL